MTEIYTVYFKMESGESSNCSFEWKHSAVGLAKLLSESDIVESGVTVTNMNREEVWTEDD